MASYFLPRKSSVPVSPTQLDIAKALGISKMTVSRALRNHPRISLSTRQKVAEMAERMGYRVNACARILAVQRRRALDQRLPIALLNLWSPPSRWRKSRWSRQLHEGCMKRAEELGYSIDEIAVRAPQMTARRVNQILKSRGIRGVLVAPTPFSHGHLNLEWDHFAAATMGYTFRRPNLHRAVFNLPLAMQLALHHLKHSRYRRIGLQLDRYFVRRSDGIPEAAFLYYQQSIPPRDRVPVLWGTWADPTQGLQEWLERYCPDVVMTSWEAVLNWLKSAGYSVPGDLGFVHLDWDVETGNSTTGISIENRVIGATAVDLVVSQLEHNEGGAPVSPIVAMITPRWIPGSTIRSNVRIRD